MALVAGNQWRMTMRLLVIFGVTAAVLIILRNRATHILKARGVHSSGADILNMNGEICAASKCASGKVTRRAATQFTLPTLNMARLRSCLGPTQDGTGGARHTVDHSMRIGAFGWHGGIPMGTRAEAPECVLTLSCSFAFLAIGG